jgi:hypothetical protein
MTTFDEWLDEIENFSMRRERLYETLLDYQGDNIEIVIEWLKAAYEVGAEHAQTYKDGYDAAMRIVKSTYPDKFPDAYFICGEGGEKDDMGLPEKIMVCPAYGLDGFAMYTKTSDYSAPEY